MIELADQLDRAFQRMKAAIPVVADVHHAPTLFFYSCASVFDVTPLLMGRESHPSHNHSATSVGIYPL